MLYRKLTASAVAWALCAPALGFANDNAELEKIRAELQQMQANYEARIQALENKLQQAGAAVEHAEQIAQRAEAAANKPATANAFNPETSLILEGSYQHKKDIPNRGITGFLPVAEAPGNTRGFSIDASELSMAANIDTWLRGYANIAMVDGSAEVEEAYFQTVGLGGGFTLKGGRFRSGIGYQNEQHPHAWDFADNSLMYQTLFGEGALQDGVQVKWLAPTDLLVELGAEAGRGAEINHYNGNGAGTVALFAHVGGDIGTSHAWRAGVSWLRAKVDAREFDGHDTNDIAIGGDFSGHSHIWLADFVYKWAPNGNTTQTNFKLQGEYFRRSEHGTLSCDNLDDTASVCDGGLAGDYRARQSGWYVQGIYQFMPRWRTGLRYDALSRGDADWLGADVGGRIASLADYDPRRVTAMLEFNPSEYSRFRLQYARDESMAGLDENQWTLQYIMSLGAHGAHRF